MKLKGKIVIIGGAEDKSNKDSSHYTESGILSRIVEESKKKTKSRIEIVTTASNVPKGIGEDYLKAFNQLGVKDVAVFNIENREQADHDDNLKRLSKADVVYFTGGNQLRLTSIFGGTEFYHLLVHRLQTDGTFIYAGTSAGAAVVSENMLFEGESQTALLKGEVKSTAGFGLIRDVVFDTHFIKRGRIGRLFQILISNPKLIGVGLEENTGLLVVNKKMEAIGPGMAIIVDPTSVKNTNLLEAREGTPLSIDSLTVHIVSKTDVYDLATRQLSIITPQECRV